MPFSVLEIVAFHQDLETLLATHRGVVHIYA